MVSRLVSKPITCAMCGGEVDNADAIEMPNGMMCLDPCYKWLESMMEEAEDDETEIEWEEDE